MHPPSPEEAKTELSLPALVTPPADPTPSPEPPPTPLAPPATVGQPTILLVEDDENSRYILGLRLERDGYQVIAVPDGQQAIQQLSTVPVDLVILDIMMPGMNGLEVLYVIRARYTPTQLPVIMVTALNSNEDIVGAFSMGANDYITKPINYGVTKARIQAQLNQSFAYRHLSDPTTTLLGGRYRIQKHLSQGGFATTYLASDTQRPGEPLCVVKKLSFAGTTAPESSAFQSGLAALEYSRELFQREAQALEELGSHPSIPHLLAYFSQAYEFYLVEEYIAGETLDERLRRGHILTVPEGLIFLEEMLATLDYIHSKGVIHRDIKPSNIICTEIASAPHYTLIDFGAIKDIYQQYSRNQKYTGFIGTPGYAPAEQFSGHTRLNSDLYALGMVAIEALCGGTPQMFAPDLHTPAGQEALQKVMRSQLASLEPSLAIILGKMIEPDPEQRYASAAAVFADLAILR